MSDNVHRKNADATRTAAAASDLPNVRQRHLRSAAASDAIADMEERAVAGAKVRNDAAAVRKAGAVDSRNVDEGDEDEE